MRTNEFAANTFSKMVQVFPNSYSDYTNIERLSDDNRTYSRRIACLTKIKNERRDGSSMTRDRF